MEHPGLTTNWVLRQFSTKKEKPEQEYRQFGREKTGEGDVGVRGNKKGT
jgi:hypothetical protein